MFVMREKYICDYNLRVNVIVIFRPPCFVTHQLSILGGQIVHIHVCSPDDYHIIVQSSLTRHWRSMWVFSEMQRCVRTGNLNWQTLHVCL
jgi:hypothetical protein